MRLHCQEHGYMDEKTGSMAECPYCEIDRLRQYEDAVTSAVNGHLMVWNFTETNCTVIEHSLWVAHLEKIEKLETALKRIEREVGTSTLEHKVAKEALEI